MTPAVLACDVRPENVEAEDHPVMMFWRVSESMHACMQAYITRSRMVSIPVIDFTLSVLELSKASTGYPVLKDVFGMESVRGHPLQRMWFWAWV